MDQLEHGDTLHLPAASDILPILRWVFTGLPGFEPPSAQTYISPGLIDRQTTLAGGGSCGLGATNFIQFCMGLGLPRWHASRATEFRDQFLRDLLLYHFISRLKTTSYYEWVMPCTLQTSDEVPGITTFDEAIGYADLNLDMLSTANRVMGLYYGTTPAVS
ncbi:hypothetical protein B0H14DRAFT_3436646 [Mycena olivaceomarginata]|nr:hypothetical protein B0H14DRAFT_3436646 [Mycena olivaceomarginata]